MPFRSFRSDDREVIAGVASGGLHEVGGAHWLLGGPAQRTPAKRMLVASELPSASLASRDILSPLLISSRKPADRGRSWQLSEP